MGRRSSVVACLVFSGLAALVYQVIWTRLLGLAFGTTTESIATVLGVFFGGMALGNLVAARRLARVRRPLRVYALLELAIGLFALASLPALRGLDDLFAALAAQHGPGLSAGLRLLAAAIVLLPPTMAMGATLPVVARGLVAEDGALGRWSAILYAANTFGAVLGAYLSGFWLLPQLGLTRSVCAAAAVNVAVALVVLAVAGGLRVARSTAGPHDESRSDPEQAHRSSRAPFLLFFGVSGFVAIGYEIVWSKVFGIVMEGTLYGFSAVLSAYLLGITLGSLAVAPRVDRIRNLPRAFGLLHLAIAASVTAGMAAIPYLPFALRYLAEASGGGDAVHLLFALVAPIVLLPTALFGAAFPVLIRIYTQRAERVGEGVGIATAVNTAGSILASLVVGFWMIPGLGMDATLYLLLLLDLAIATVVLLGFQAGPIRKRTASAGLAAAVLLGVAFFFGGVGAEKAIAGRTLARSSLTDYEERLDRVDDSRAFLSEGRSSIVTVHETPLARTLRNNGLPEAGVMLGPPYLARETVLLGVLPYLISQSPERALVIGLGGANTVDALARTGLSSIDVVELEPGVVDAARVLYAGRESPLDDPRVHVRIGDGRHELLLGRQPGGPRYDVIASQPSHPWVAGAANLFTEEFFALARESLTQDGVFALWVNGFRTDPESILALVTSFERVFPGALLIDAGWAKPRDSLLLLGAHGPIRIDAARLAARIEEPRLRELLGLFALDRPERLLALSEGPAATFAALSPAASNTDDNAFIETRIPRRLEWSALDFGAIEARLSDAAPVLPPIDGSADVAAIARGLIDNADGRPGGMSERVWPYARRLDRLLRAHGAALDETTREVLRADAGTRGTASEAEAVARLRTLAQSAPGRPEPLRALGLHLALRKQDFAAAAAAFAAAFARSGESQDAFDAGRALHHVDPSRSFEWFDRIPTADRPRFSRLAVYDAERALAAGTRGASLRPFYDALVRHRNTAQGRVLPELPELLARVAGAAGDADAARLWSDVAFQQRLARGSAALGRARTALEAGHLEAVEAPLAEAQRALPADARVLELRARLARAQGDPAALDRALGRLRDLAPSLEMAIVSENRFRVQLGLPLLPPRSAADLFVRRP
ncbi:MAG: fused MFS/spermidine synthase [Deltaproteobacteria bacterium]|nr:fused MFS/spermidine synthase [Deltaproteobacteria bacterium]